MHGNWIILSFSFEKFASMHIEKAIIFFYHKCVIYQHAVHPKTNVNDECYASVLKILWQYILRKYYELVRNWILHHDNACSYAASSVQQHLSKCNVKIGSHFLLQCGSYTMKFLIHSDIIAEAPWQKIWCRFYSYFTSANLFGAASKKRVLYLLWKIGWTKGPF